MRARVAAEGPAALTLLSYFAARSSNRRLVNSSAFSARLRQRSAYAFKKFVSITPPTQQQAHSCTVASTTGLGCALKLWINELVHVAFDGLYSITSSASACNVAGTARPGCFAGWR